VGCAGRGICARAALCSHRHKAPRRQA
jgi:hypothetical protein